MSLISFIIVIAICLVNLFLSGCTTSVQIDFNVSVAITTIPPRFSSVHYTVRSWIRQQRSVQHIFLFVPTNYRRFRRKIKANNYGSSRTHNLAEDLRSALFKHEDLRQYLENNTIQIMSTEKDWGPITRIIGCLSIVDQLYHRLAMAQSMKSIDYWIFSDDDVIYDETVLTVYYEKLQVLRQATIFSGNKIPIGLSQFAETYRLLIPSSGDIPGVNMIPHVQGVDTYLVSHQHLIEHAQTQGILSYSRFASTVEWIHNKCINTFYQDDYVVSVMLYIGDIRFMSVWENYQKLVHHVEGVSTSHFQMHMDPQVFEREQQTKQCLPSLVPQIYKSVILANRDDGPTLDL